MEQGDMICFMRVTAFCNMGCAHCIQPEESRSLKDTMTFDTVRKTAVMLKEIQERRGRTPGGATILFQGGEVMLVPVEWYRDSAIILDEVLPGHQENMQTSLIPYSHKWADIVHERFRGVLGTSIDFSTRQINGSVGEYQRIWLEKVGMARKDGIELFPVTVVTKGELGKAPFLIDWFLYNGFSYVTFEKYVEYGHMLFSDMTKNSEYSGFLIQAFDDTFKRMKAGKKVLYINPILSSLRGILSGEPGHKWGVSCLENTLSVFPDGRLHSCPPRSAQESYGNLSEGHGSFLESPIRIANIRDYHMNHVLPDCLTCPHMSWCRSGCPIEQLDGDGECTGFRMFLDHVEKSLENPDTFQLAREYLESGTEIEQRGLFLSTEREGVNGRKA